MGTDWNLIATAREGRFRQAQTLLAGHGRVHRSAFYNVLLVNAPEPREVLETLQAEPGIGSLLSHVAVVERLFFYQSRREFESEALAALLPLLPQLADHTFHVRMHRRGFKGRISSQGEEQFLDHTLMDGLAARGKGGRITFDRPDFIIAVESVGQHAGSALWSRDELNRLPLLGLD